MSSSSTSSNAKLEKDNQSLAVNPFIHQNCVKVDGTPNLLGRPCKAVQR